MENELHNWRADHLSPGWLPSLVRHHLYTELGPVFLSFVAKPAHCTSHRGWRTHVCMCVSVNKTITGSYNGLSPVQHQATIWTNDGLLLTRPLEINFSEILITVQQLSYQKMNLEISAKKCSHSSRPQCVKGFLLFAPQFMSRSAARLPT